MKAATTPECPTTKKLTLLSKRHMLMIVYTLLPKPQNFGELQKILNINTATLSERLRELETEGIVLKLPCPTDSRCHFYGLTTTGKRISKLIEKFSSV